MFKCYFLLDKILHDPYTSISFENSMGRSSLHFLLGHFEGFSYSNLFHINQFDFLDKDKLKFILQPIHMPLSVELNLSGTAIDLINNDANVYLCLLSFQECLITPDELKKELQKHRINSKKVIVLCSNIDANNQTLHGVRYIAINFWESVSKHQHQTLPDIAATSINDYNIDAATKKFLCLNRNIKPHRIWLMYSMIQSNILDQGHVSYALPEIDKDEHKTCALSVHTLKHIPNELHNDFKMTLLQKMYVRRLDSLDNKHVINYNSSIKKYYNDSVLSVITESDSHKNFITEKTYKAIMNLHPFFIIGNPTQHSLLRTRGYETFEDLFGINAVMNYTQALDLWNNINAMDLNVLKENIKQKYLDKLIHNQKLFLSRVVSWDNIVDTIIETVN